MTVTGGLWRVLASATSLLIAFWMAHVIDLGVPATWSAVHRYAWGITMFVLMFYGVGTGVQVLQPLLGGSEISWFPKRSELRGRSGLLAVLTVGLGVLLAVIALALIRPALVGRAAVAGGGMFILFLAINRSRGFWGAGSIQELRAAFGDRLVVIVYALLGLALIAAAIFAHL